MKDTYIVMTASERMPNSCWGRYGKVAVVKLEKNFHGIPKMISKRAIGVQKIYQEWRRLNVGTTSRCAFRRALAEAERTVAELNARSTR